MGKRWLDAGQVKTDKGADWMMSLIILKYLAEVSSPDKERSITLAFEKTLYTGYFLLGLLFHGQHKYNAHFQ